MIVALLPVSVLEQTQSPVLKQRDSLFGTCPCQSLLTSPQLFQLLSAMLFYSIFHLPICKIPCQGVHLITCGWAPCSGSSVRGNGEGSWEQSCGKRNYAASCRYAASYAASRTVEKRETRTDVCIWRRAVWKRGQERESKAGETKFELPSSSVQSHSSTRQISLKCSSGLGSSVSSATNGVNSSASSC